MEKTVVFEIRKHYKQVRPSEQKVANALLAPGINASALSIEGLAGLSGVSQPTVIRFANALGCRGFKELKWRLMEDKARADCGGSHTDAPPFPVSPQDKLIDIPVRVISTNIKQLEDALKAQSAYETSEAKSSNN